MRLRAIAIMALALPGFCVRAQADDVRLFTPVPAGPVGPSEPAPRTADAPPRLLAMRPALDISGEDQPPPRPADAPWQVAPQAATKAAAPPATAQWQTVGPAGPDGPRH